MAHHTTLEQIVTLSLAEQALLNQQDWSAADYKQFADMREDLAKLWNERRAELVFERAGPPRLVSAPDPRSVRQVARGIAYGIQPLPQGGD